MILLQSILIISIISFIFFGMIYKYYSYKLHDYLKLKYREKYQEIYPDVFLCSELNFILSKDDLGDERVAILKHKCKSVSLIILISFVLAFFSGMIVLH